MKHFHFTILLSLLMSMAGTKVYAYDFDVDNIYYNIIEDGNSVYAGVAGCSSELESVNIPSRVYYGGGWLVVKEICKNAFDYIYHENLRYVTLPANTLEIIREGAFQSCGISEITFPSSLKIIERNAFYGTYLRDVYIPATVESIGDYAFGGNDCLKQFIVDSGNQYYSSVDGLLYDKEQTRLLSFPYGKESGTIHIPSTVKEFYISRYRNNLQFIVNSKTWYELNKSEFPHFIEREYDDDGNVISEPTHTILDDETPLGPVDGKVIIPEGVECIGNCMFYLDEHYTNTEIYYDLKDVILPNSIKYIGNSSFSGCYGLEHINFPEGLISIGNSAFYKCGLLSSVTLPSSITSIGQSAFYGCNNLTSVEVGFSTPLSISASSFSNRANATLYVPIGSKAAYQTADYWKEFKEIVEVAPPSSIIEFADANVKAICVANWDTDGDGELNEAEAAAVTNLGGVFQNKNITSFNELQYFTGLTAISYGGFLNCSSLASIIIPENVTSIGESSFRDCSNLSSLTLGKNLAGIGNYSFQGCSKLPCVSIPKSVKTIGIDAFLNCSGITAVYITDLSSWIQIDFDWDENYGGTPNPLRYAHHLYVNGTLLAGNVIIPEGSTGIHRYAFDGCTDMTAITIPSSIRGIGSDAFRGCDNLSAVYIDDLSAWCKISFGDNPLSKARHLYVNNVEIENMVIPNDIETIGEKTFIHYNALKSVEISNSVKNIGDYAFAYCGNLESVIIPNSVSRMGECIFINCNNLTSITIENEIPPYVIENNTFYDVCSHVTLYVPAGSKAAYEAADYWMEFKEIVEVVGPEPQTDNVLSASAPTILTGKEASLSLNLTNEDLIIMTEFYMQLPDGITIEEDEDGYPIVTINSERENKHVIEVNRNSEGLYHFLCYSSKNNAFKGNEGGLFSMNLICAEGVTAGTYTATVKDIIMSDVDRNELTQSDFTFDITVLDVAMGDANGDGRINGMDIVEMVDYIMERPSNSFVFAAADLTSDGKVNGMDLVELVSLVMAQGATQAAPPSALPRREGTLQTEKLDEGALTLKRNENGGVMLGVENPDEFILAQMVVEVSNGALTDIKTDNSHVAVWSPIGENRYAVLAYSTRNRSFTVNDCLLTFLGCEENVTVKDVMLVDAYHEARFFADVTYNGTTGIEPTPNPSMKRGESIYDLSGRKLETRNMELGTSPKGVYIVNGKKVVVK